jgi:anti-sigma28 factor (negative regulator of flagellin synthesis)
MSDLGQQNNEPAVITQNTDVCLDSDFGNRPIERTTALPLQKNNLLPLVRRKKILKLRRQLAEGTYEIDERLSIALDRLLDKLIG